MLWLLRPLMKAGPRWVLVLDGGQAGVAPEVHETVRRLARLVTIAQYRSRIRLVLLDYLSAPPGAGVMAFLTEKLPGVKYADLMTETLPPATDIRAEDLLPCLQAWDHRRQKDGLPRVTAAELSKLADGLLARAPAEGKARLAALHNDLVLLVDMLAAGLDGAH